MSSLNGLSLDWNTPFGSSLGIAPMSQPIQTSGGANTDGGRRDRAYSSGHSPNSSPGRGAIGGVPGGGGGRDRAYSSGHSPNSSSGRGATGGVPGGGGISGIGGSGGGGGGRAIGQSWPPVTDTFSPWGDSLSSASGPADTLSFGHPGGGSGGGGGGGNHGAPPGLGPPRDSNVSVALSSSFSSSIADAPNPPQSSIVAGSFDASARDPLWNTVEKLRADLTACQLELNKCRAENAGLRQQLGYR